MALSIILTIAAPAAVLLAVVSFARLVRARRRAGSPYEFHPPISGAYGGGFTEGPAFEQPDDAGQSSQGQ